MSFEKPIKKKRKVMGAVSSSSSSASVYAPPSIGSSLALPMHSVPFEILEEIFYNLPYDQVVRHCRLVCKQWKEVSDSEPLWRERCRREGFLPRDVTSTPNDWRKHYVLSKKRRNLLKNPGAEKKFKHWQIIENGGDRWKIEDPMVPHPNGNVQKNFVTSFQYAARWDCACEYTIKVELLDENKKSIQKFTPEIVHFEQWNDQQWHQMTHIFTNYGAGVRYVHFVHGGQDSQFWAGWYGIRVTDSCVEVCPEV